MCLIICTERCVKTHLSLSIKLAIWLGYLKSEMCFLRDEQNYTEEFFTIAACVPRNPPVYRLQDYDGDIIEGCFYEKELQKIIVNQDKSFKIEKILDRKKRGNQISVSRNGSDGRLNFRHGCRNGPLWTYRIHKVTSDCHKGHS